MSDASITLVTTAEASNSKNMHFIQCWFSDRLKQGSRSASSRFSLSTRCWAWWPVLRVYLFKCACSSCVLICILIEKNYKILLITYLVNFTQIHAKDLFYCHKSWTVIKIINQTVNYFYNVPIRLQNRVFRYSRMCTVTEIEFVDFSVCFCSELGL